MKEQMQPREDFEVIDVEQYGSGKGESFSHASLVMTALRKCFELGSKEMRAGYFNERQDFKGNVIKTYIEDTRKAFIESVKSLLMIVACDFDSDAKEKIPALIESIKTEKKRIIENIDTAWDGMELDDKNIYLSQGYAHKRGKLDHPELQKELIDFEVEVHRNIVAEVSKLTERLDYYGELLLEG